MNWNAGTVLIIGLAAVSSMSSARATQADAGFPTCSDVLDIEVHGHHVVADYVAGLDHHDMSWPPKGREIGEAIAGQGAVVPGGPGPGFHFPNGVAPGASFCTGSKSPGLHF
jgi:hypothetical protein